MKRVNPLIWSSLVLGVVCGLVQPCLALPELMNVWHIPTNEEPPTVTMRNPVQPTTETAAVYLYLGGWPSSMIDTAALYYRVNEETWQTLTMEYDSTQPNDNVYYIANIPGPFTDGTVVAYYFKATKAGYETTYVYGSDTTTNTTEAESTAQAAPYTFSFGTGPTPSPTSTPTQGTPGPTATATPTASPTPDGQPTATPTPNDVTVSASIMTNHDIFTAGMYFLLRSEIINEGQPLTVNHYVLLNLGDGYWFWPSWRADPPDFKTKQLQPRNSYVDIPLQFVWPAGVGAIDPIVFIIALQHAGTGEFLTWSQCQCSAN